MSSSTKYHRLGSRVKICRTCEVGVERLVTVTDWVLSCVLRVSVVQGVSPDQSASNTNT